MRLPSAGWAKGPSDATVRVSAMPVAGSPPRLCATRTAALVSGPAAPSMSPPYMPCRASATCTPAIRGLGAAAADAAIARQAAPTTKAQAVDSRRYRTHAGRKVIGSRRRPPPQGRLKSTIMSAVQRREWTEVREAGLAAARPVPPLQCSPCACEVLVAPGTADGVAEAVAAGPGGDRPVVVDLHAIAPGVALEIAALLARAGLVTVDGSISGPSPHAARRTRVNLSGPRERGGRTAFPAPEPSSSGPRSVASLRSRSRRT